MVLDNFQGQGVLLVWIVVGQWPTVLAVCAVGVVWILSLAYQFFSFCLSLGDGSIQTKKSQ